MKLTELEEDLLGDLAQDDHAVYEVFHFVRAHHPAAEDAEVLRVGRNLVAQWLQRGWLALSEHDGLKPPGGAGDLLNIIDRKGIEGTYEFANAPWLALAPKAREDVEWLRAVG